MHNCSPIRSLMHLTLLSGSLGRVASIQSSRHVFAHYSTELPARGLDSSVHKARLHAVCSRCMLIVSRVWTTDPKANISHTDEQTQC